MSDNNEYTDNMRDDQTNESTGYINAGSTGNNMANKADDYDSDSTYNRSESSYSASDDSDYERAEAYKESESAGAYRSSESTAAGSSFENTESGRSYSDARFTSPYGKDKGKKNSGKKPNGLLKKACAIALSAVLFGGVAGGTIVGIQYGAQKAGIISDSSTQTTGATESSASKATIHTTDSTQTTATATSTSSNVIGDVSSVVEKVLPSVVAITNTQIYESYNTNPWSYFYGGSSGSTQQEVTGSGSGIIIGQNDTELLIVTNYHVIEDANSLTITFNDESTASASVKGTDSDNDLAVVAVKLADLSNDTMNSIAIATLHTADDLKVGQGVIAIGNALGYGQSITVGYISALNRSVSTSDGTSRELLQTDAAINPGNSGGALINADGEIIGINSAKYSDTDVEGMGFAIPISKVTDIIDDLMNQETKIEVAEENRGYIGIEGISVSSSNPLMTNMPAGVYVYTILENGAAADSDLKTGDIISKINGTSVANMEELQAQLKYYEIGKTITLTINRQNASGTYEETTVNVTLKEQSQSSSTSSNGSSGYNRKQNGYSSGQSYSDSSSSGSSSIFEYFFK